MASTAAAPPPTGSDLLPDPVELHQRLAANIQERRILEGLLKVIEKDAHLKASARRIGALRPREAVSA